MRHVESFYIEEGQSQQELCNQINQHANDNNLLIFSISFSHPRRAFVVFEPDFQECKAPDELPIMIEALKEPVETITISMSDIKQDSFDMGDYISGYSKVVVSHDGKTHIQRGDTTHEAISKLIKQIERKTGCRVLVDCGSNGKQDASFFMKRHDKLMADRSKH